MPLPVFEVSILAPDHALFEGRVRSIVAPGVDGYFGVLARHAPMIAQLGTGVLSVATEQGKQEFFACNAGFMEIEPDQVTILADTAEAAQEIDMARARAAERRARERLRSHGPDIDIARAEAALQRAIVRLRAVEKSRGSG
ncbi:MAG: F0F1 ATP synthase subunit epsilon [Armatimonadetes bacterium]|nr:F0F1 ATP synthase subunit epsilon [Armatimonadota bacterium]